jgi:hypothetical protein
VKAWVLKSGMDVLVEVLESEVLLLEKCWASALESNP